MDFLIWVAIFIVGGLALSVPAVRVTVAWLFAAILGPPLLLTRGKMVTRPEFRLVTDGGTTPVPAADGAATTTAPVLPAMVASQLARRADDLVALGFQLRGTWHSENTVMKTETFAQVLTHEPSRTAATIIVTVIPPGRSTITLSLGTFDPSPPDGRSGRSRWTCGAANPNPGAAPEQGTAHLPSFQAPRLLLQAHTALAGTVPPTVDADMPHSNEQWQEFLTRATWNSFQPLVKNGTMRLHSDGTARPTISGAFANTFAALWPLKQRRQRVALAAERTLLGSCGQLPLLEQALANPLPDSDNESIDTATGTQLVPDDRGIPAAIMPPPQRVRQAANDPAVTALHKRASEQPVLESKPLRRRDALVLTFAAFAAFGSLAALFPIVGGTPIVLGALVMCIGLIVLATLRGSRSEPAPSDFDPGRATILIRGVCPSCLYRLNGLPTEPDGCLVCPECGAAWRRDRISEFLPPVAEQPEPSPIRLGGTRPTGKATTDARGRPVVCASPSLHAERAFASREVAARLDRVLPSVRSTGRIRRFAVAGLVVLVLINPSLTGAFAGWSTYVQTAWLAFILYLIYLNAKAVIYGSVGRPPAFIIKTLLAESLCPACVLPLDGRQPESDGCTVCSCGAAWRLPAAAVPPAASVPPAAAPSPPPASTMTSA